MTRFVLISGNGWDRPTFLCLLNSLRIHIQHYSLVILGLCKTHRLHFPRKLQFTSISPSCRLWFAKNCQKRTCKPFRESAQYVNARWIIHAWLILALQIRNVDEISQFFVSPRVFTIPFSRRFYSMLPFSHTDFQANYYTK